MKKVVLFLGVLLILGLTSNADAEVLTATDNGWSITFDTQRQAEGGIFREGLVNWVDPFGNDHVWESSWWGRGDDGGGEGPLSDLSLKSWSYPALNQIAMTYEESSSIQVDLWYGLTGINNVFSTISEKATLTNLSTVPMTLSIFEYSDFNLTGTNTDDIASFDAGMNGIMQYDDLTGVLVMPYSAAPSHFQIAGFPSLVDALSDSEPTTLTDSGSPYGPGDATFAFQWDFALEPGEAYTVEKMNFLKTTAPEPVSCVLFLVGGGALFAGRRLRRKIV